MAFRKKINDLNGLIILVVLTLPSIAANVDCNGKPFRCVNTTHFMICVDLGSGISSTIDDFVIPCPPTTVCKGTNHFECELPTVTIATTAASTIQDKAASARIDTYEATTSVPFDGYYDTVSTSTPFENLLTHETITTEPVPSNKVTENINLITLSPESNFTLREVTKIVAEAVQDESVTHKLTKVSFSVVTTNPVLDETKNVTVVETAKSPSDSTFNNNVLNTIAALQRDLNPTDILRTTVSSNKHIVNDTLRAKNVSSTIAPLQFDLNLVNTSSSSVLFSSTIEIGNETILPVITNTSSTTEFPATTIETGNDTILPLIKNTSSTTEFLATTTETDDETILSVIKNTSSTTSFPATTLENGNETILPVIKNTSSTTEFPATTIETGNETIWSVIKNTSSTTEFPATTIKTGNDTILPVIKNTSSTTEFPATTIETGDETILPVIKNTSSTTEFPATTIETGNETILPVIKNTSSTTEFPATTIETANETILPVIKNMSSKITDLKNNLNLVNTTSTVLLSTKIGPGNEIIVPVIKNTSNATGDLKNDLNISNTSSTTVLYLNIMNTLNTTELPDTTIKTNNETVLPELKKMLINITNLNLINTLSTTVLPSIPIGAGNEITVPVIKNTSSTIPDLQNDLSIMDTSNTIDLPSATIDTSNETIYTVKMSTGLVAPRNDLKPLNTLNTTVLPPTGNETILPVIRNNSSITAFLQNDLNESNTSSSTVLPATTTETGNKKTLTVKINISSNSTALQNDLNPINTTSTPVLSDTTIDTGTETILAVTKNTISTLAALQNDLNITSSTTVLPDAITVSIVRENMSSNIIDLQNDLNIVTNTTALPSTSIETGNETILPLISTKLINTSRIIAALQNDSNLMDNVNTTVLPTYTIGTGYETMFTVNKNTSTIATLHNDQNFINNTSSTVSPAFKQDYLTSLFTVSNMLLSDNVVDIVTESIMHEATDNSDKIISDSSTIIPKNLIGSTDSEPNYYSTQHDNGNTYFDTDALLSISNATIRQTIIESKINATVTQNNSEANKQGHGFLPPTEISTLSIDIIETTSNPKTIVPITVDVTSSIANETEEIFKINLDTDNNSEAFKTLFLETTSKSYREPATMSHSEIATQSFANGTEIIETNTNTLQKTHDFDTHNNYSRFSLNISTENVTNYVSSANNKLISAGPAQAHINTNIYHDETITLTENKTESNKGTSESYKEHVTLLLSENIVTQSSGNDSNINGIDIVEITPNPILQRTLHSIATHNNIVKATFNDIQDNNTNVFLNAQTRNGTFNITSFPNVNSIVKYNKTKAIIALSTETAFKIYEEPITISAVETFTASETIGILNISNNPDKTEIISENKTESIKDPSASNQIQSSITTEKPPAFNRVDQLILSKSVDTKNPFDHKLLIPPIIQADTTTNTTDVTEIISKPTENATYITKENKTTEIKSVETSKVVETSLVSETESAYSSPVSVTEFAYFSPISVTEFTSSQPISVTDSTNSPISVSESVSSPPISVTEYAYSSPKLPNPFITIDIRDPIVHDILKEASVNENYKTKSDIESNIGENVVHRTNQSIDSYKSTVPVALILNTESNSIRNFTERTKLANTEEITTVNGKLPINVKNIVSKFNWTQPTDRSSLLNNIHKESQNKPDLSANVTTNRHATDILVHQLNAAVNKNISKTLIHQKMFNTVNTEQPLNLESIKSKSDAKLTLNQTTVASLLLDNLRPEIQTLSDVLSNRTISQSPMGEPIHKLYFDGNRSISINLANSTINKSGIVQQSSEQLTNTNITNKPDAINIARTNLLPKTNFPHSIMNYSELDQHSNLDSQPSTAIKTPSFILKADSYATASGDVKNPYLKAVADPLKATTTTDSSIKAIRSMLNTDVKPLLIPNENLQANNMLNQRNLGEAPFTSDVEIISVPKKVISQKTTPTKGSMSSPSLLDAHYIMSDVKPIQTSLHSQTSLKSKPTEQTDLKNEDSEKEADGKKLETNSEEKHVSRKQSEAFDSYGTGQHKITSTTYPVNSNLNQNIKLKSTESAIDTTKPNSNQMRFDTTIELTTKKMDEMSETQSIANIEQISSATSTQKDVTRIDRTTSPYVGSHINARTSNIGTDTVYYNSQTNSTAGKKQISVPTSGSAKVNLTNYICKPNIRGRFSDSKDCRKFYICIGKPEPINGICPNNTVFSEVWKQCTKNLSHCVRNHQFQCVSEGRFSDYLKDNIYYICVKKPYENFIRFRLQCQLGYHLNKTSVRCELNTELNQSTSQQSTSDQSVSSAKSEKLVDKSSGFECKKEGKFPDLNECRKYYVCSKKGKSQYRLKRRECDSDEIFHKDKKKCVDADSYDCN